MNLIFTKLHPKAQLPVYMTESSAGADLFACLDEPVILASGQHGLIPTGLTASFPSGYELQIRPKSGLALKHALTVLNAPGTIDADYRGEIGIILMNHGPNPFTVEHGMAVAQMLPAKVHTMSMYEQVDGKYHPYDAVKQEARTGGFGSTVVTKCS